MKIFSKTLFCTGLVSLLSAPAQAVTWSGSDGWEVQYNGFINLFYNQMEFEYNDGREESSAVLNEGLLPSFHTMKARSPTVNGLTGTSQITFAVDTSTDKGVNLNKSGEGDALIDLREVFFNVEGSFGTISVGRTLALYQRQSVLKDMTLFGVGGLAHPDSNGTALGRIGIGYVYPDFRARFLWQSPETHGFQTSLGVFQPREAFSTPDGATIETDVPMFQGEMTYNNTDLANSGVNLSAWAGFIWQEATVEVPGIDAKPAITGTNAEAAAEAIAASSLDVTTTGWNVGAEFGFRNFAVLGTYYNGKGLGTLFTQGGIGCSDPVQVRGGTNVAATCTETDNHGGYVQGTYTIPGSGESKTKLGLSWGYSGQEAEASIDFANERNRGYTMGVYHDVNSWLKVIAEYNDYDIEALAGQPKAVGFSLGAFMFW